MHLTWPRHNVYLSSPTPLGLPFHHVCSVRCGRTDACALVETAHGALWFAMQKDHWVCLPGVASPCTRVYICVPVYTRDMKNDTSIVLVGLISALFEVGL